LNQLSDIAAALRATRVNVSSLSPTAIVFTAHLLINTQVLFDCGNPRQQIDFFREDRIARAQLPAVQPAGE
jgi:hypothetical protein